MSIRRARRARRARDRRVNIAVLNTAAVTILTAVPMAGSAFAADVTSTWIGPALGAESWSNAANWSNTPNVAQFPNNGNGGLTYDALVTNGGTALLTQNINLQNFTLLSSAIDGTGNLTAHQSMTWTAGGMRGTGVTIIPVGSTLNLSGVGRRSLTRTIDNFGTTIWSAGGLTGDTFAALGAFINEPGATFRARDSFISQGAFGIGSFLNAGLLVKDAGTESRWGGITTFRNTGTVLVGTGLVRFPGPMADISASSLTGGTWIVDSTNADGGTARLQLDRPVVMNIGPSARVELIGAGAAFDQITPLAGNQGSFRLASGKTFSTLGAYSNTGTTTLGSTSALEVNGDLQNTGTIDISGGMVVRYVSTSPLAAMQAQIVAARNGGNWNMPGITSSAARASSAHNTTLGIMEGTDFQSLYGAGAPFFGFASSNTSVLVKYTYYGDTDFNGRVNFDDYVRTDNGFNNHLSGWLNGDFDLNNVVNFDDYVLIDLAFNTQSGTLGRAQSFLDGSDPSTAGMDGAALRLLQKHASEFGAAYTSHFLSAVPEPSGTLFAIGVALLTTSRKRRPR